MIESLSSTLTDTTIVLGDFNAKSPTWGSAPLDSKGIQVEDLLNDLELTTLNNGQNTYLSRSYGTGSAIDITAINYLSAPLANWSILENAISDHRPIITTLDLYLEPAKQVKCSWNFRKANWRDFTKNLEDICINNPLSGDINNMMQIFSTSLKKASKMSIPRGKRKDTWIPFWKEHNIDKLIIERDNINERLKTNYTVEL